MAIERLFNTVGPLLFTTNGGENGLITISSTKGFKVKAYVVIEADSLSPLTLEVKRVLNKTQLLVGVAGNIQERYNLSEYTTAINSKITQPQQPRINVPKDDQGRATYETEPTLARRVILVDEQGEFYSTDNPLQVELSDGSINIGTVNANLNVQLTDKESAEGENDYDIVRIGDGEHQLDILPNGSIPITISGIKLPFIQNINIVSADTEYSFTIPQATKKFYIKNRGLGKLQLSFITAQTNTNFITLASGVVYSEEALALESNLTVYYRSSKASEVIEILRWE